MRTYLQMIAACILFFSIGVTVGGIKQIREGVIQSLSPDEKFVVCFAKKCEAYDTITYTWNNTGFPIIGKRVIVYDCVVSDGCGIYRMYDTVPAVVAKGSE